MKHLIFISWIVVLMQNCWQVTFVSTDQKFSGKIAKKNPPELFIDRLPKKAFYSVGVLEVTGPAGEFTLDKVTEAAIKKGQKLGCDLVIDRAIYQVSSSHHDNTQSAFNQTIGFVVYQYQAPPQQTQVYQAPPPPGHREFICGIWAESP